MIAKKKEEVIAKNTAAVIIKYKPTPNGDGQDPRGPNSNLASEEILGEDSLARLFDKKQTKDSYWKTVEYV
jgi:hypothetical protein